MSIRYNLLKNMTILIYIRSAKENDLLPAKIPRSGINSFLRSHQRWLKLIQTVPLIKKPELLNGILTETEELIKIFVARIKTVEKKKK
ncbi:MAG: hypothetical protein ACKVE4_03590 [Dissulfuribacterales bacterium]